MVDVNGSCRCEFSSNEDTHFVARIWGHQDAIQCYETCVAAKIKYSEVEVVLDCND